MKCPFCEKEGILAYAYYDLGRSPRCGWVTAPFRDNDGNTHFHNERPSFGGDVFNCSNGHRFSVTHYKKCPVKNCEWNQTAKEDEIELLEKKS